MMASADDDIDSLMVAITRTRTRLTSAKAAMQRWEGIHAKARTKADKGTALIHISDARGRAVGAEQQLLKLEKKLSQMEEKTLKQEEADAAASIFALADACDLHAAKLGAALRQLHVQITAARQRTGRGPSSLVVWPGLERCCRKYLADTVMRSLAGAPRLAKQLGFREQVEKWAPSLTSAQPSSTMAA
jgi:hypothetical protein